jgi:hypothetical protein
VRRCSVLVTNYCIEGWSEAMYCSVLVLVIDGGVRL